MSNPSPIQVESIDHVTLVVKNLEQSRKFYVDLLGMKEVSRPHFDFEGSWFQAGETFLHTILEYEETGPAGNTVSQELTISRTQHFAFILNDPQGAVAHLQKEGVPIVSGPKQRPDGAIQVFIQDPDGYVIELSHLP
ncbi:Lactoylglutathione lyase [hydrothermal vent metagenome]|uniref:Lactoylglutathione lyase n=1 Tax=hydrothermal vent metagenome TaxID=652676 RepID=A0A3B1D9M5_9ZZZZ